MDKELMDELLDMIHQVSKGDPNFPCWEYDDSNPFENPGVTAYSPVDGPSEIGSFKSKWDTRLAVLSVNAVPHLLSELREARQRIAQLEAGER